MAALEMAMLMNNKESPLPQLMTTAMIIGAIIFVIIMMTGWNPFSMYYSGMKQATTDTAKNAGKIAKDTAKTVSELINDAKTKYDSSKGLCGSAAVGGEKDKVDCLRAQLAYCNSGDFLVNNGGGQNQSCYTDRGVPLCNTNPVCADASGNNILCPCYPNDVPCAFFGTYDSKFGQCGDPTQGGMKCFSDCCKQPGNGSQAKCKE